MTICLKYVSLKYVIIKMKNNNDKEKVRSLVPVKSSHKKLVIVESPTKARTIRKFLGQNFDVISCMGHVRDLPSSAKDIPEKYRKESWSKLGVNVDRDFSPLYCVPPKKKKTITELKQKLKNASELYLATDEDREGESISWHLLEILKPKVPVKRMVFHEITRKAILESLESTRQINEDLVRAQEARRILDRLVGYTISPLLWKKIAYGLSAGRVQSVVVQILTERELERMKFISADYWNLLAELSPQSSQTQETPLPEKQTFQAKLLSLDNKKIAKGQDFDPETGKLFKNKQVDTLWLSKEKAEKLRQEIQSATWKVIEVNKKTLYRKPPSPFITSTLQQDASRRFRWGATHVMRVAQALYEQGHITYMRTDSTFISSQAINTVRQSIQKLYGKEYLPDRPRSYASKKVKGAQEAHEAIRPSGTDFQHPSQMKLEKDQLKLYDLIWRRTIASQMTDSKQRQVSFRIQAHQAIFSVSGTTIEFLGFLKAYEEGRDEAKDEENIILPDLQEGDLLTCHKIESTLHKTKPAARYTEASIIQTMEKRGIGRPSTYAPTISTITQRGYVIKQNSVLIPTFTALVVSQLLKSHLPDYVESEFTSEMEESLDNIAEGRLDWVKYLKGIYFGDAGLKDLVKKQEEEIDPNEARSLNGIEEFKQKDLDQFEFRVGKYGAYVCKEGTEGKVCASIPDVQPPAEVDAEWINKLIEKKLTGADAFGKDPQTGQPIYLLEGRYGPYIQLGELGDALGLSKTSIKRASIPKHLSSEDLTLEQALFLLSLPKTLGHHPQDKKPIKVGNGQFGPYIVHEKDYRSIPKEDNLFSIDLKRALELLAQEKRGRGRKAQTPLKELGRHEEKPLAIYEGRYGPYIKWDKKNYALPKDVPLEKVNLKKAIEIIDNKIKEDPKFKSKKSYKKKASKK